MGFPCGMVDAIADVIAIGDWEQEDIWATVRGMPHITIYGLTREVGMAQSKAIPVGCEYFRTVRRTRCLSLVFLASNALPMLRAAVPAAVAIVICDDGLHNIGVGCVTPPAWLPKEGQQHHGMTGRIFPRRRVPSKTNKTHQMSVFYVQLLC